MPALCLECGREGTHHEGSRSRLVEASGYGAVAGEFFFEGRSMAEVKGKGLMRTYFLEGRREDAL